MYAVHGLPPGSAEPCAELLLDQHPPEDRARILDAFKAAADEGRPFALETVLVRPDGAQRVVVLVGEPAADDEGRTRAVDGLCVDVTDSRAADGPADRTTAALQLEVTQLRSAMASRAVIEQAKGILMLLTTCTEQVAFDLLAHISSHTHRKVRDVASTITESAAGKTRLPDDVREILRDACPPTHPLR
jgi:hypothetical protein